MFNWLISTRIIQGAEIIKQLPTILNIRELQRTFLITDKGVREAGVAANVEDAVGPGNIMYVLVLPHQSGLAQWRRDAMVPTTDTSR